MSAKSVVVLQGPTIQDEALASVAVKAGYLLIRNTDGTVKPHDSAAATALDVLVAVERSEIGESIDSPAIPIGDTVKFIRAVPGNKLTMWLENGANVAVEARLESAGDGTLQAFTTGKAPFRAYEALNNTSGAAAKIQVTVVDD